MENLFYICPGCRDITSHERGSVVKCHNCKPKDRQYYCFPIGQAPVNLLSDLGVNAGNLSAATIYTLNGEKTFFEINGNIHQAWPEQEAPAEPCNSEKKQYILDRLTEGAERGEVSSQILLCELASLGLVSSMGTVSFDELYSELKKKHG